MKKVLIFGTGNFAKALKFWINKYTDWEVVGFTVDEKYIQEHTYEGLQIYAFDDLEEKFPPSEYEIVLTLGYGKMNEMRKEKFKEIKGKGYHLPNFIHPSVVQDFASMGEGNIVLENVILGAFVEIGNCNIVFGNCHVAHGCKMGDFNFLCGNALMGGEAVLGENCFLGMNSVVGSAKTMGDYTFLGMGACVNKDTEKNSVYVPERTKKLEDKDSIVMMSYVGKH